MSRIFCPNGIKGERGVVSISSAKVINLRPILRCCPSRLCVAGSCVSGCAQCERLPVGLCGAVSGGICAVAIRLVGDLVCENCPSRVKGGITRGRISGLRRAEAI